MKDINKIQFAYHHLHLIWTPQYHYYVKQTHLSAFSMSEHNEKVRGVARKIESLGTYRKNTARME